MLELQEEDLVFFSFSSYFLFYFSIFLFSIFYFLAPRVRISDNIGHMAQRRF